MTIQMRSPATRRGLLRGLASLPLIGGGVALIGSPTAAAEPVTEQLLDNYDTWLFYERRYLRFERFGNDRRGDFVHLANAAGAFHCDEPAPSRRAAVVLSAVGCDWREGGL